MSLHIAKIDKGPAINELQNRFLAEQTWVSALAKAFL